MATMMRQCKNVDLTLTTSEATSPVLDIGEYASGEVYIPTGSAITTLTYYSSSKSNDTTFIPCQDAAGAAVAQTVAQTKCYPIPAAVMGCACLKIVASNAGAIALTLKT